MQTAGRRKRRDVLIVEDDPGAAKLTVEALKQCGIPTRLSVATSRADAMAILCHQQGHELAPAPDLILLDLRLPDSTGLELLEAIRSDARLQHIPVVILTSSDDERDVVDAYRAAANCYASKPLDMAEFTGLVRSLAEFWFEVVRIPGKRPA